MQFNRSETLLDTERVVLEALADDVATAVDQLPDDSAWKPTLKVGLALLRCAAPRGASGLRGDTLDTSDALAWHEVDGEWRLVPDEDVVLAALADSYAVALEWLPREFVWELSLSRELDALREWTS